MTPDPCLARVQADRAIWDELVSDVERGEIVEIRRGGKPVAMMIGSDHLAELRRAVSG